jgi:multiple sugar transport system substrate-binding protein
MIKGLYPVTLEAYKRPDGIYGLPRDFQTIVLFYNKDMFDAAGVAYPTDSWTMDDLRDAAKKLTKDSNGDGITDQWGFFTDLYDMELFWSEAIWGNGGEIISKDYTKTLIGEDKAKEALQFLGDLVLTDKSTIDPTAVAQFGDPFAAGVAAMTTYGHWVVPEYAANLKFKWDVSAFPAGKVARVTSVNSAGFVVAKDSKNPDAALEFLKYAIGPEGQSRLAELGFAIPVLESVANSPAYLEQKSAQINHKVFLDALEYARVKPSFKGYEEWSTVVGDGLLPVWNAEKSLDDGLNEIVPAADEVLAKNQ